MNASTATLSDLAEELNRCEIALSIGMSRKEERKWAKYQKEVKAEINRRSPVDANVTDAELVSALSEMMPQGDMTDAEWQSDYSAWCD